MNFTPLACLEAFLNEQKMRYNVKINLLALPDAFVCPIKGRTDTKKCICIPLDSESVFVGEKSISVSATAYENTNYGQSHTLRLSIDTARYNAMTEDERKAIPYIGHMKEFMGEAGNTNMEVQTPPEDQDLPF